MAAFFEQRRGCFDRPGHHRGEVELRLRERHRAVGDARDVQEIVDEAGEMLDLADDHVDVLTRLRIHASFQQPSGREDRSQRVAQLVREEREELVLSAIGSAECVLDRALAGHVRDRVDQAWHAVDLALRAREDDSDDSPVLGALGDLETSLRRRGAAQRFDERRSFRG